MFIFVGVFPKESQDPTVKQEVRVSRAVADEKSVHGDSETAYSVSWASA